MKANYLSGQNILALQIKDTNGLAYNINIGIEDAYRLAAAIKVGLALAELRDNGKPTSSGADSTAKRQTRKKPLREVPETNSTHPA